MLQTFNEVLLDRAFFVLIGAMFAVLMKEGLTVLSTHRKSLGIGFSLLLLAFIFIVGLPYFERLFNFDVFSSLLFLGALVVMGTILITKFREENISETETGDVIDE